MSRPLLRRALLATLAGLCLAAPPAAAQQKPKPRVDTTRAAPLDTTRVAPLATGRVAADTGRTAAADTAGRTLLISPAKAFLRSLLVPGWGEASAHSYVRGGIFFAIETVSDYMLIKTIAKLNSAKSWENVRRTFVTDSFWTRAGQDSVFADSIARRGGLELAIDSVPAVRDAHGLVRSRKKQREDWITLAIFWTLAGGADAYINAQLSDFPTAIQIEPRSGGGLEIRAVLPARKPW